MLQLIVDKEQSLKEFTENNYAQASFFWNTLLKNKEILEFDGVNSIESFDEEYLEVSTTVGIVCVEGKGLKIEALEQQSSKIIVKGEISGVFYKEEKAPRGFFGNIFCF